ncbi:MAG: hypothetical protein SFU87_15445, partial [Chitinophagaceae bacterium]|nr:hypothetical protein [Chitinophagaceae bacterium]
MTLTFNEEGKLLSGYLPRYNPVLCKDECINDFTLIIRVLLPIDYLADEDKKIREKASEIDNAIFDTLSTLYRILNCHEPAKLRTLRDDVMKDTIAWRFDSVYNLITKNSTASWNLDSVYKLIKDSSIAQSLDFEYRSILDMLVQHNFNFIYRVSKDSLILRRPGLDQKNPFDTIVTTQFSTRFTTQKTQIDNWNFNHVPDIFPKEL